MEREYVSLSLSLSLSFPSEILNKNTPLIYFSLLLLLLLALLLVLLLLALLLLLLLWCAHARAARETGMHGCVKLREPDPEDQGAKRTCRETWQTAFKGNKGHSVDRRVKGQTGTNQPWKCVII